MSDHISDSNLVQSFRRGQSAAFDDLYNRHIKGVYAFIYYRTMDKMTAEDLTSMTFMKALEKIGSYNPEKAAFSTWIYRIARNTVIDHYRSTKQTDDIDSVWDLSSDENPIADASTSMDIEHVREELQLLPQEKREMIIMRLWDGLSYKEIATLTGKTESACKMTFSRTMQELKGTLSPITLTLLLLLPHVIHE